MGSTAIVYSAKDRRGCIPMRWNLHKPQTWAAEYASTPFEILDVLLLPDQQIYFHAGRLGMKSSDVREVRIDEAKLVHDGNCSNGPLHLNTHRAIEALVTASAYVHTTPSLLKDEVSIAVKFLIPLKGGYVVRSDFLEHRMELCPNVAYVSSFVKHGEYVAGRFDEQSSRGSALKGLEALFSMAVGAICIQAESKDALWESLGDAERQMVNRLSYPWLVPNPLHPRTLVMVEARRHPAISGSSQGIWKAAQALGIRLVVMDKRGHWAQDARYAHLRHHFLEVDMTVDSKLHLRIVEAIRAWGEHLDGILTFVDHFMTEVAKAAVALDLPTPSPDGLLVAADKYETRSLESSPGRDCILIKSLDEYMAMKQDSGFPSGFPLVVKPQHGSTSEGTYRVSDEAELDAAIKLNLQPYFLGKYGSGMVIQRYEDGPEVDINLVLFQKQVLFSEVVDDFPSSADFRTGVDANFQQTGNAVPSGLPWSEQSTLISSAQRCLQKIGLHTGTFHVEARVHNSSMKYEVIDGIMDLRKISEQGQTRTSHIPSMFILEINARQPGFMAAFQSECVRGVDWFALRLLFAIGEPEKARTCALSQPYLDGPQGYSRMLQWWAEYPGTFKASELFDEICERRPDISAHIYRARCFAKKGEDIPDPRNGAASMLAYSIIHSSKSREDAMMWAEQLRIEVGQLVEPNVVLKTTSEVQGR